MATRTSHVEKNVRMGSGAVIEAVSGDDGRWMTPRLTSEHVRDALSKASFAILSYVTPSREPRSSGVVYKTIDGRLYVAVAADSWKARHIAANGRVAVTVPVRRGGILSLMAPVPPATISFHGTAIVHPAGSPRALSLLKQLGSLIPAERQYSGSIIEIVPEGEFLTYAVGVPLRKMRDPAAALARVAVPRGTGAITVSSPARRP